MHSPGLLGAALLFSLMTLADALPASAQGTTLLQLSQPTQRLYDGGSRLTAARFANGEILTAQQTPLRNSSRLALVRYSADGRELRRIEGGGDSGFDSSDQISKIIALPDGGALVSGMTWGYGVPVVPYLFRLTQDGRVAWRVSAQFTSPHRDDFFAGWTVHRGERGELILHGIFKDGTLRLPGSPDWRPRRMYNPFMARVDADTGRVVWAKRIARDGQGLLRGGTFSIIDTEVPTTHHGEPPPASSVLRVDRYDLDGHRLRGSQDRLPGAVAVRGAVAPIRNGGFAVATETCRRQDADHRCLTEGIVYVYDAAGTRIARHDVPAWSVMARSTQGAPMRVLGPSALRRPMVGGSARLVADEVEVLTFDDPTAAPTRARIAIRDTRFVSLTNSTLFGGVSTPEGLLMYSPSAFLEPGTTERGVAGDMLLYIRDANFRPVHELPRLASDPYPAYREPRVANMF